MEKTTSIDNSTNPNVNLVFTSKMLRSDGQPYRFYANVEVLNLSWQRGVSAMKAKRFFEMKIDEENLKALVDDACEGFNKQDYVRSARAMFEIRSRLKLIVEERSILDLICIYYFMQDEDPLFASAVKNKEKREVIDNDPEAQAFFLRIGVGLISQFTNMPETKILSYLEETKALAESTLHFLSETRINPSTSS
jgi:hypothetical protein